MAIETALHDLLVALDAARGEIADRSAARLRQHLAAYRNIDAAAIAATDNRLIALFVRLMRGGGAASLDVRLLADLAAVSELRAQQGVGVGDMHAAVLLLVSVAREVTFASLPERALREASLAWSEIERTVALVLAWMVDEHARRVVAG